MKFHKCLIVFLFCQTLMFGQSYLPSFSEKFDKYSNLDDFETRTSSNPQIREDIFSFTQLKPQDMEFDSDTSVGNRENIKDPQIVDSPTDTNNKVLQVRLKQNNFTTADNLNSSDKNYIRRSELVRYAYNSHYKIKTGDEIWYGFKIYLHDQFSADAEECTVSTNGEKSIDILSQILIGEWQLKSLDLDPLASGPVFDIFIQGKNWKAKYTNFSIANKVTEDLGAFENNKWVEFLVHLKISDDNTGLVQVWKDNDLVVNQCGFQNSPEKEISGEMLENDLQYNFKFGIYKPHINTCASDTSMEYNNPDTDRIVYFDDVWLDNTLSPKVKMDGIRLHPKNCEMVVTTENPFIELTEIPGQHTYTILLRKEAYGDEPAEDVYFGSNSAKINLLEVLPANLKSNRNYSIAIRIQGHSLYNEYSRSVSTFETGDLSLRLISQQCDTKVVTAKNPYVSFIDVPRDNNLIILLRKEAYGNEPFEDVYFTSSTARVNLLKENPSNLKSNRTYTINARINGHPLYNEYATKVCSFTTGNLIQIIDPNRNLERTKQASALIYPNPVAASKTIYFDKKVEFLRIYDLNGRMIYQSGDALGSLNLKSLNLTEGLYFFKTDYFSKQVIVR